MKYKRILFWLIVAFIVHLFAFFLFRTVGGDYQVQSCHFSSKNLTCAKRNGLVCTTDLQPTDACGALVTCTPNGWVFKLPLYNFCVDYYSARK